MTEERPQCFACGRLVRPGIRCAQTFCPWDHSLNKQGIVVLARPLRLRIK